MRTRLAKSLRSRVLLLTLAAFAAIAVPACISFVWIVNGTVVKLGTLFAEKQILYDRYRGMEALVREVALAETLARSPAVGEWALDEEHAAKKARGLAELEHFRHAFQDRSYFFVVDNSGNYYYNDAAGSYTGKQLRYTVQRDNPRDGWYFTTSAAGAGCQLNVDHDDVLAVTKVWINCVIEREGRVLGILGTGIDLSTFIKDVVNSDQRGVESLFVDRAGSIQAFRDERQIDYHSLTKLAEDRKTVFRMLDSEVDRSELADMLDYVAAGPDRVQARFLSMDGRDVLVGVGYLDRLGWYNVTLMEVDEIIDRNLFAPIAALFAIMMLAAAILVTWLFKRSVLDRLARVEETVAHVALGRPADAIVDCGEDEIGRLSRAMNVMAARVEENRVSLEEAVRHRTQQLEQIAYLDVMTQIPNRRAFTEAFEARRRKAAPTDRAGIVIFDVDAFKLFNDRHGHALGDRVVREVADKLVAAIGEADICARWGGDEFVVLTPVADRAALRLFATALCRALATVAVQTEAGEPLSITVSVGAHLISPGETLDIAIHRADLALYSAKRAGRDRAEVYDPAKHEGGGTRVA